MEAMVFNDRYRCDAAYVLDGEGSERNGPGSKPGDADRQASGMKKAIAALATPVGSDNAPHMGCGTEFRWTREQATTAA